VADRAIWNRYWQSDRIASCFDDAGTHNYPESIADGWRAFFGSLPGGTRILDLCTGNGAIAVIAAEISRAEDKGFEIIAVDQADIDPIAFVSGHKEELELIDFRPRADVEALPFGDDSFGAVVSQYGIEYTELSRSLDELFRVTAPGGRARLVLHAAEGVVNADSRPIIEEADFLLETIDLPGAAKRCFEALAVAERNADAGEDAHRHARESLAAFEDALMQVARRIPDAADRTMLRNCGAVLLDTFKRRARLDVDQLVGKAEEIRGELLAHRGRLRALVEASVTRSGLEAIAATFGEAGATVEEAELRQGAALVGYVVEARFTN
jgi:SAM-dependent methyltransferase